MTQKQIEFNISLDSLNNFEGGRFMLSNLAAKRAKQLKDGAPALVKISSNNPLTIALAEIAAGKIHASSQKDSGDDTPSVFADTDEAREKELGLLLPAIETLDEDIEEADIDLLDDTAALDDSEDDSEDSSDDLDVIDQDENTVSLDDIDENDDSESEDEKDSE